MTTKKTTKKKTPTKDQQIAILRGALLDLKSQAKSAAIWLDYAKNFIPEEREDGHQYVGTALQGVNDAITSAEVLLWGVKLCIESGLIHAPKS
jgi:hypothetical protein